MKPHRLRRCFSIRATVRMLVGALFSAGWAALFGIAAMTAHAAGPPEADLPSIIVNGTSEVSVAPDRATVRRLHAIIKARDCPQA